MSITVDKTIYKFQSQNKLGYDLGYRALNQISIALCQKSRIVRILTPDNQEVQGFVLLYLSYIEHVSDLSKREIIELEAKLKAIAASKRVSFYQLLAANCYVQSPLYKNRG